MKKSIVLAVFLLFLPGVAFCAGSYTAVSCDYGNSSGLKVCTTTLTADAADASFPAVPIVGPGGYITNVCISEGSTATDGTITVALTRTDTNINYLGSQGTNVTTGGASGYACMKPYDWKNESYSAGQSGNLTLQITGGGVNSANPLVVITIDPAR